MNKLKTQNFNNLLNYQHFLKNNSLKKKRFKLKNILFENQILYKNQDLNIIELKNSENIEIPTTVLDFKTTSTIQTLYENKILFNYNLNYNILYNFNKIMFNYKKKNNNNKIKGRVMKGNTRKIIMAVLGFTFSMKPFNLNNLIRNKKKFYARKNKNYKYKNFFYNFKKVKINQTIRSYKLRYLNFKIEKNKNKSLFSRISYVEDIIKYLRIKKLKKRMLLERKKKIKSYLSRKGYVKKQKKQK
jgi:hypothetical protein